jgi:hypothetical protein
MGAHSSAESLMAGVESDSIRVKATSYAMILNGWLYGPAPGGHQDIYRLLENGREDTNPLFPSDVIELLRGVRDVLEAVGCG